MPRCQHERHPRAVARVESCGLPVVWSVETLAKEKSPSEGSETTQARLVPTRATMIEYATAGLGFDSFGAGTLLDFIMSRRVLDGLSTRCSDRSGEVRYQNRVNRHPEGQSTPEDC